MRINNGRKTEEKSGIKEADNGTAVEKEITEVIENEKLEIEVEDSSSVENLNEEQEKKVVNKIKKEDLEKRIARGDFRITQNFVFKDGAKHLKVDYKDTDRNYLLKKSPLIDHFKEKYPHQEFIILE